MPFFAIGPLHPDIATLSTSTPAALYLFKIPQKAKEVLSEPVLFFIDNLNVLVSLHTHGKALLLGGRAAPDNSKSPDVHELAAGSVCANDFVDTITRKIKQQNLNEGNT